MNNVTVKRKFHTLRMDELFDSLQDLAVYWTLEFVDSFLPVSIHAHHRHKTVFHTLTRKSKYTCVPFRLVKPLAKLKWQVNPESSGTTNEGWMERYMEGGLTCSQTVQDHL